MPTSSRGCTLGSLGGGDAEAFGLNDHREVVGYSKTKKAADDAFRSNVANCVKSCPEYPQMRILREHRGGCVI